MMKPTAIFINTGRGPTVDEAALVKALQEGWIAAAGLDVLEQEPPAPGNPLLQMDNVILTAHVASASARFDPARRRRVGREIALVLGGKWPRTGESFRAREDRAPALAALLDGARPGRVVPRPRSPIRATHGPAGLSAGPSSDPRRWLSLSDPLGLDWPFLAELANVAL